MKDEIFKSLKTKYANLGVGDKAFKAAASLLASRVTEESQIETEIVGVEDLLKAFQGEKDQLRTENAILKKQLDDRGDKEKQAKPDDVSKKESKNFLTRDDLLSALKDFQKEQTDKTQKEQEYLDKINSVKSELSNRGIKESTFNLIIGNMKNSNSLSKEELTSSIEKEFDLLRSDITPEAGKPKMSTLGNGDQVPSDIADFLKGKQTEISQAQSSEKKLV